MTLAEIAGEMFVSANTIKTHAHSIYRKLGVTSRRAAVVAAPAGTQLLHDAANPR
jgi:LuxR family maltose regulon positive regulatory protein